MSKRFYIEVKNHTNNTETRSQVLAREQKFRNAIRNVVPIVVKSKKERDAEAKAAAEAEKAEKRLEKEILK